MKKNIDIPVPINLGKKTEEQPINKEVEDLDMMDPTTDFEIGEEPPDYPYNVEYGTDSPQIKTHSPEEIKKGSQPESADYIQVGPIENVPSMTTVASTGPEGEAYDGYAVYPTIPEKKKRDFFFASKREKWIFLAFITPPFVISFISMLHMVSLFETSNLYWMAVTTAIAVELAAMSSLVALVTLNKLNKTTIWSIFGVLAGLQILGNMYHAFINMSISEINSILTLLALENTPWAIRLVMFLVSGILPVIALTFVKGIVDYFKER